jgi:hypothetical protein
MNGRGDDQQLVPDFDPLLGARVEGPLVPDDQRDDSVPGQSKLADFHTSQPGLLGNPDL